MSAANLLFLDTETTGLDPRVHDVWEIAFAVDDGPIRSFVLPHSLKTADPKALELNGYWERYPLGAPADGPHVDPMLRAEFEGKTVVGANPAFDAAFLFARWGVQPWHYRMIDVESVALGFLDYDRPKGLKGIADDIRNSGHEIPEPDHTAAGDVATLRAVYRALRAAA